MNSSIVLDADPSMWFYEIERDVPDEGYVLYVTIGNVSLKGSTMRSKFGLRSNCFFVDYDEETETFTFTVYGYGHGIGMSQWGAQGMALDGYTYVTILRHYYQGTEVVYCEPHTLYEGSVSDNVSREEPVSSEEESESEISSVPSENTSSHVSEQVSSVPDQVVSDGSDVSQKTESVPPDEEFQSANFRTEQNE